MIFLSYDTIRTANSMVEYSAFNRFVPGSNPGQSIRQKANGDSQK